MKKMLFLLLVVAFACTEEKVVKYDSLAGDWHMKGDISGGFTLAAVGDEWAVDHGWFEVDGVRHELTLKTKVEKNTNFRITIFLIGGDHSCTLRFCDYDLVNFQTIEPESVDYYGDGSYEYYYDIRVTR